MKVLLRFILYFYININFIIINLVLAIINKACEIYKKYKFLTETFERLEL